MKTPHGNKFDPGFLTILIVWAMSEVKQDHKIEYQMDPDQNEENQYEGCRYRLRSTSPLGALDPLSL